MDRKQLAIAFSVVAIVVTAIIVLLATGGDDPDEITSGPVGGGGVELDDGPDPPEETELANIIEAAVGTDGDFILFHAQVGAEIPRRLDDGTLDFRWEIYQEGTEVFIVSANLDVGPNASVISQGAEDRFGISTLEEDFPGSIAVQGDRMIIRINPDEIPDFPTEFTWVLKTTLDGVTGDPGSGLASDRAPEEGFGSYSR